MKKLWGAVLSCVLVVGCTAKDDQTEAKAIINGQDAPSIFSFLPENDYDQLTYLQSGDMTEKEFKTVLAVAYKIYSPIIKNFGATFYVRGNFADPTVNAYASTKGNDWTVQFFGGLAKHYEMTVPGFTLVVCHEIAHLVGGFPFYSGMTLAVEGQADYMGAQACARKMFESEELRNYDHVIYDYCDPEGIENKEICNLTLDGGLSLGRVLASLTGEVLPSFETPSKVIMRRTMQKHPPAQCRTDSYKAGALCTKKWNDSVIPGTKLKAAPVSCQKPRCWYAG